MELVVCERTCSLHTTSCFCREGWKRSASVLLFFCLMAPIIPSLSGSSCFWHGFISKIYCFKLVTISYYLFNILYAQHYAHETYMYVYLIILKKSIFIVKVSTKRPRWWLNLTQIRRSGVGST